MIKRYAREEMAQIWSAWNRYKTWLMVEVLVCEAWAELGEIPKEAVENIKKKAKFNPHRIDELEKVIKHDVIAFLTNVSEEVGEDSRYIHYGITSSDMLDNALSFLLVKASDLLIEDIEGLREALKKKAFEHKDTVMIGRTHGVHAEPLTFGLKMALYYDEFGRNLERLKRAREEIRVGKISGAVGTYSHVPPRVEEYVCEKLGLEPARISTQIVQRDNHANFFMTLAVIGSSVEKMAVEIRHLQRSEVREAEEYFSPGQKGSSAMPHKRNPVLSENITGLARLLHSYAVAGLENVPLWHERDISHSSVERVIAPDATIVLDFMLIRAKGLIENLLVYPDRMMQNLNLLKGLIFSEGVLLSLTKAGISREEAYEIVQRNAMRVWEGEGDFQSLLLEDNDVKKYLSKDDLDEIFDLKNYTKNVDYIFKRVFGKNSPRKDTENHWSKRTEDRG